MPHKLRVLQARHARCACCAVPSCIRATRRDFTQRIGTRASGEISSALLVQLFLSHAQRHSNRCSRRRHHYFVAGTAAPGSTWTILATDRYFRKHVSCEGACDVRHVLSDEWCAILFMRRDYFQCGNTSDTRTSPPTLAFRFGLSLVSV